MMALLIEAELFELWVNYRVTVSIVLIVEVEVLMFVFRFVEGLSLTDFCSDRLIKDCLCCPHRFFSKCFLLITVIENAGSILRAAISTLAASISGIV